MIDVKEAREAYNRGIVEDVIWIGRNFNIADAMTKATNQPLLAEVMKTGKTHYEIEQSVQRQVEQDNPTNDTTKEENAECASSYKLSATKKEKMPNVRTNEKQAIKGCLENKQNKPKTKEYAKQLKL